MSPLLWIRGFQPAVHGRVWSTRTFLPVRERVSHAQEVTVRTQLLHRPPGVLAKAQCAMACWETDPRPPRGRLLLPNCVIGVHPRPWACELRAVTVEKAKGSPSPSQASGSLGRISPQGWGINILGFSGQEAMSSTLGATVTLHADAHKANSLLHSLPLKMQQPLLVGGPHPSRQVSHSLLWGRPFPGQQIAESGHISHLFTCLSSKMTGLSLE